MKRTRLIWGISLIVLGVDAIALGLFRLLDAGVPDGVVRGIGVLSLAAVLVLAYTTVRLFGKKKGE